MFHLGKNQKPDGYLVCEQKLVYALLMASAGPLNTNTSLRRRTIPRAILPKITPVPSVEVKITS